MIKNMMNHLGSIPVQHPSDYPTPTATAAIPVDLGGWEHRYVFWMIQTR
jgi:hypothetical protein